jgi:hypothetical protein
MPIKITLDNGIERALSCWPKIPCKSPKISAQLSSTSIKTSWPARTRTSSKDRWILTLFIGLTFQGKQGYPNKKKKISPRKTPTHTPRNTNVGERFSTVDLLINIACFCKNLNNIFNIKADLN